MDLLGMLPRNQDQETQGRDYINSPWTPPYLARPGGIGVFLKNRWGSSKFISSKTIPAITDKSIARSSFIPNAPTNLKIDHKEGMLSWDESVCATNYIVKIMIEDKVIKTMNVSENQAIIKDIDACSEYEVYVTAVTHGKHKNVSLHEKIEPPTISADQLDLDISPTIGAVKVSLAHPISCVGPYQFRLCQHESCRETVTVHQAKPVLEFPNLESCSTYNISVKTLMLEQNYLERIFPFSTLPKYEIFNLITKPSSNSVELSWDPATCSTGYRLRVCKDGSATDECQNLDMTISETSKTRITMKVEDLLPSTPYTVHVVTTTEKLQLKGEIKSFETDAAEPTAYKKGNFGSIIVGVAVVIVMAAVAGLYCLFKSVKPREPQGSEQKVSIESGRPDTPNRHLELDEKTSCL